MEAKINERKNPWNQFLSQSFIFPRKKQGRNRENDPRSYFGPVTSAEGCQELFVLRRQTFQFLAGFQGAVKLLGHPASRVRLLLARIFQISRQIEEEVDVHLVEVDLVLVIVVGGQAFLVELAGSFQFSEGRFPVALFEGDTSLDVVVDGG